MSADDQGSVVEDEDEDALPDPRDHRKSFTQGFLYGLKQWRKAQEERGLGVDTETYELCANGYDLLIDWECDKQTDESPPDVTKGSPKSHH